MPFRTLPDSELHYKPPGLRRLIIEHPRAALILIGAVDEKLVSAGPERQFKTVRAALQSGESSAELKSAYRRSLLQCALEEETPVVTAKHRSHAGSFAVALAKLSDGQFDRVLAAAPEQPVASGGIASTLTFSEHLALAEWQFGAGWGFRKWLEPGSLSRPDLAEGVARFRTLESDNRFFALRMTNAIFENFRFLSDQAKDHLFAAAQIVDQQGYNLDQAEFVAPETGIPLLSGESARLRATIHLPLADLLAHQHHCSWMANRKLSHGLPALLRQPSDEARNVQDGAARYWDLQRRGPEWTPDIRNIYALTVALPRLHLAHPRVLSAWLGRRFE